MDLILSEQQRNKVILQIRSITNEDSSILVSSSSSKTKVLVVENTNISSNYLSAAQLTSQPTGDVQSTNVQSAIAELASEKARKSYTRTFSQTELDIANLLVVQHQLATLSPQVSLWNNNRQNFWPDNIICNDINIIYVDLSSFVPLQGTYTVVVSE